MAALSRKLWYALLLLGLSACSAPQPPPIGPQSALTNPPKPPPRPLSPPAAVPVPPPSVPQVEAPRAFLETGLATWYKRSRHTHTTSSGEALDDALFTAAHRTLPLGSFVRVTDTGTGSAVIVRVNDRGPFTKGFIIDLSRSAADTLGLLRDHKMVVGLELLAAPPDADHPSVPISTLPTGKAAVAALTPPKKHAAAKTPPKKTAAAKTAASKPAPAKGTKPAPGKTAPKPKKPS